MLPKDQIEAPGLALEVYKSLHADDVPREEQDLEREGVMPADTGRKAAAGNRRRKALVLIIVILLCIALAGSVFVYFL